MTTPATEAPPLRALRAAERAGLLPAGRLLIACSGGADSLALLYAAARLSRWTLATVFIDHGLGPHSRQAAAVVQDASRSLNIPNFKVKVSCDTGAGPEDRARRARLAALDALAEVEGFDQVALAHTREDQLETVLMRWATGAGLHGLAGMPAQRGRFRRPWLSVARADVRFWLQEQGITWFEDPSNDHLAFLRNRVRSHVLPAMDEVFGPGWRGAAAASADLLRAADDLMETLAADAQASLGPAPWPVAALQALSPVIRHRVLATHLRVGDPRRQRDAMRVIDEVIHRPHGTVTRPLPGRRVVIRAYGQLTITSTRHERPAPPPVELAGPGEVAWGNIRLVVEAGRGAIEVDAAATPFPWTVRAPSPGDRIQLLGAPGHKRISKLLIDARVPRTERHGPVVCDSSGPLWVRGLRVAERVRTGLGPTWRIRLEEVESSPALAASDAGPPLPAG